MYIMYIMYKGPFSAGGDDNDAKLAKEKPSAVSVLKKNGILLLLCTQISSILFILLDLYFSSFRKTRFIINAFC